jgi:hypothetical protein
MSECGGFRTWRCEEKKSVVGVERKMKETEPKLLRGAEGRYIY